MKKKILSLVSLLLAGACMPVMPAAGFGISFEETYRLETERFTFHVEERDSSYVAPYRRGYLEIPDAEADFIVTGVFIADTEPPGLYPKQFACLDPINQEQNTVSGDWSTIPSTRDETFHVGDIVRASQVSYYQASIPSYLPANFTVVGTAQELLGEGWEQVVHQMMHTEHSDNMALEGAGGCLRVAEYHCDYTGVPILHGDVTDDGETDIMDVISLNKYLLSAANFHEYEKLVADTDGSGEVDSVDALNLLKYVAGVIDTLPAEQAE